VTTAVQARPRAQRSAAAGVPSVVVMATKPDRLITRMVRLPEDRSASALQIRPTPSARSGKEVYRQACCPQLG